MELGIIISMVVICSIFTVLACYKTIQILQLESYRIKGFFNYLYRTSYDLLARYFAYAFFAFTSMLVYIMCLSTEKYISLIGYAFYILISVVFVIAITKEKKKTPLKFTSRVKRLYVLSTIFILALSFVSVYFSFDTIFKYVFCGLLPLFIIPIVLLSQIILLPIENAINNNYKKQAQRKLNEYNTVCIGITGSYGKTTAKNILFAMLSKKFDVFASPKSYNTPMGLARTINNDLKPNQIFIAEMGARYVGDIAELVQMLNPKYGVITSIGCQHIQSFGSMENIVKTKFEIADINGKLFINGDDELLVEKAKTLLNKEVICSGQQGTVKYDNVKYDAEGISFVLIMPDGEYEVSTSLIGEYIPSTIALMASVAHKLGVESEMIVQAITELKPVEHRLQLIKNERAIVIDDAYNANPEGAKAALNALNRFDGTKVIITPGLVELGNKQDEINKDFGNSIANVCDYALVVGVNSKAIMAGIKQANKNTKAYKFDFLHQAMAFYSKLDIQNPVVLFENDLPDNL